jgi:hypothetical protein
MPVNFFNAFHDLYAVHTAYAISWLCNHIMPFIGAGRNTCGKFPRVCPICAEAACSVNDSRPNASAFHGLPGFEAISQESGAGTRGRPAALANIAGVDIEAFAAGMKQWL